MGIKKKEKKNNKSEVKKLDKKTFKRINVKFREYWRCLFQLIFFYIIAYLFWAFVIVKYGKELAKSHGLNGEVLWFTMVMILLQGLLFSLDGFVTSLLKSPFNQMCFAINKSEGITDKKKDYIITKATESNEHCKETLKKFGIITIATELLRNFIKSEGERGKEAPYEKLMVLSYLIPIFFAAFDIYLIHKELKKIRQNLDTANGKKTKTN